MALTVATLGTNPSSPTVPGSRRSRAVKLTLDNSYPTGGYAVTAGLFGLTQLDSVMLHGSSLAGRIIAYDSANKKILVFSAVTTEIGNGVDLSLDSLICTASGL